MKRIFSLLILMMVTHLVCFALGEDVVIDPTVKHYYVKMKSDGLGNGHSWEDAMDGETFAQYLPLVGDDVTFHVAKGDYMPPYSDDLVSNEDTGLGYKFGISYSVKSNVTIIGGYPESPNDESVPDYKQNETRFIPLVSTDNQHIFELSPNSSLTISSVYFEGSSKVIRSPFYVADAVLIIKDAVMSNIDCGIGNGATCVCAWLKGDCDLNFNNVVFKQNGSSQGDRAGLIHFDKSATQNVSFLDCSFDSNNNSISSSSLLYLQGANNTCSFERCSFNKNVFKGGYIFFSDGGRLDVTNCTFYGNVAGSHDLLYAPTECKAYFTYNTIIQDVNSDNELFYVGGNAKMTLSNNIIMNWSDAAFYSLNAIAEINSSKNLVSNKSSDSDILIGDEFASILDGEKVDGLWTPILDYHGGLTKSVALKKDTLLDGTSIRVTLARRDPEEDQRKYPRSSSTCVGAYEICEAVRVNVSDTISLGESFMGKKYTMIGQYTNLFDTLVSIYGCDSIRNHTLFVMPNPATKAYYVKENGSGDGSSWDKALSPKMFDYVLKTLSTDDVTFYIAAGRYIPYYNRSCQEVKDRTRSWQTRHPVTMIGGFPANSTGTVKSTDIPNVKKYPTTLDGDYDGDDKIVLNGCSFTIENISNDINGSLLTIDMMQGGGVITLSNLIFTGVRDPKGSPSSITVWGKSGSKSKLVLNQCEIKKTEKGVSTSNVSELVVNDCEFNYIINNGIYTDAVCNINRTTFNHCSTALEMATTEGENWLTNSTFVGNKIDFYCESSYGSSVGKVTNRFYNNTFISCDGTGNSTMKGDRSYYFYGNIFAGSVLNFENASSSSSDIVVDIKNNVFACGVKNLTLDNSNIISSRADIFDGVLDVDYDKTDDIASANLKNESGITPTVALLKDVLQDGTSLRFPRLEKVLSDQRGEDRLESTCMGAYEIPCVEDIQEETKEIFVGEEFNGVVYSEVGSFKIQKKSKNDVGCESIVNYTLLVKPDPTTKKYYVKIDGTGDGSSWEKAMNGDDFATYLPLVSDGTTFYVAEGRYLPIYSILVYDGSVYNEYKGYTINTSVSLIGGFAPNAKTGAVADPRIYKTVFTGDPSGDDYYSENQPYLEDPSGDDISVRWLFSANSTNELHITGCELSGTSHQYKTDNNKLGWSVKCGNLFLSNCTFDKIGTIEAGEKMVADSCIFRNRSTITSPSSAIVVEELYVTNSIFENGEGISGGCFGRVRNLIDARNSVFYNMKNSGSLFSPKELYLYNNLFVNISATGSSGKLFTIGNSAEIVGNMFKDCRYDAVANSTESAIIMHNLCENIKGTENDIQTDDLGEDIVDCVYNETTGTATPKFTDWGGYVPTVITKSDKLSDGTSIRFPLEETKVESDQRGVTRIPKTCMGIYEIPCVEDIQEETKEIFVGEEFNGVVYSKVGSFKIQKKSKNDVGCEGIVNYTLLVKPDPTTKKYYVKIDGTGDGSSWEKAMNGDDFATYLPLVPDGTTFYVAEGRYLPIYSAGIVYGGSVYDENKGYTINTSVSIMGGFAPNAKTGAVADPRIYKTVFTGDPSGDDYYNNDNYSSLEDPSGDDIAVQNLFIANPSSELIITGCELSGTAFQYSIHNDRLGEPIECGTLYLSNCTLDKTGTIWAGKKMVADSSVFRNRTSCSSPSSAFSVEDLYVTNSIFENGKGTSGGCFGRVRNLIDARNSVFYNMMNSNSLFSPKELYLYNNLFVNISANGSSDKLFTIGNSAEIVGNMFKDCRYDAVANSTESAIIKHNLCENIKGTENDIQTDDLSDDIVDCVYNETTGTATPKFTDWGGYVPTVITKSDKLSDGTSIRFPLEETKVESDQRGVNRLPKTCMGIYEISCVEDIQEATKTIYVGETFNGVVYDNFGQYDNIEVKTVDEMGCETTVIYTLYVDPDPTRLFYYVKKERWNKGDGSRWEDAMNGDDFAYCISRVPDGTSFYIAAGEYQPIFDKSLGTPEQKSNLTYKINSSVSIYGGYEDGAETGAVSDPSKYHTIFNGDISKNDKIDETLGSDGFPLLTKSNRDDNISCMFQTLNEEPHDLLFDGIVVTNVKDYAFNILFNDKHLTLSRDSFEYNDMVVQMPSSRCTLSVSNTTFYRNDDCLVMPNVDIVSMDRVRFEDNRRRLLYVTRSDDEVGNVYMNHVSAISNPSSDGFGIWGYNVNIKKSLFEKNINKLFYISGNNSTVTISDSRFENNNVSNILLNEDNSDLYIVDCDFVENKSSGLLLNHNSNYRNFYLTKTSFIGNESQSSLIYALADSFIVDSVIFNHNKEHNVICGQAIPYSKITNSIFSDNKLLNRSVETASSSMIFYNSSKSLGKPAREILYKNTFMNNVSDNVFTSTSSIDTILAFNNTIVSNEALNSLFSVDETVLNLYNNTIIGNSVGENVIHLIASPLNMIGNILIGNVDPSGKKAEKIMSDYGILENISYNILPAFESVWDNCSFVPDESNIISLVDPSKSTCPDFQNVLSRNQDILTTLFDGTYDQSNGVFTPKVEYKGAFTPVVVLKSTHLSDMTSIRFPRLDNVLQDQIAQSRLVKTCMGAYEITCSEDNVAASETISVGEKFKDGVEYKEAGKYENIKVLYTNISGCDSIVTYTLYVTPEHSSLNYYVKMHGTGDGSSWLNAMNGDDFAAKLPLAPDGATFYVAEGEYQPIYGRDFATPEKTADLCYEVNSKVTIIGGYPDYAESDEKSEPDKFETIFNGDIKHDNKEIYDGAYSAKLNFENDKDNVEVLFAQKADMNLYGVKIKGCYDPDANPRGPIVMENDDLKLSLRLVDFKGNTTCVHGSDKSEIYVDSCRFVKNVSCGSKAGAIVNNGTLVVKNSIFHQCNTCYYGGAILSNSGSIVDIENSTFDSCYAYSGAAISLGQSSRIRSVNSTYVNNESKNAIIYGVYSSCELYNNTIFSNEVADDHTIYFGGNSVLKMVGNVIESIEISGYSDPITSNNNIFMCDLTSRGSQSAWSGESDVIVMNGKDCSTCFDGTYDNVSNKFKATLSNEIGFAPTVAVIKDKLPDGTSIRFPMIADITKDERGVNRLDQTCIGAYEYDGFDWDEMCSDPVLLFREDFGKGEPTSDFSMTPLPDGVTTLIFQPNFPLATNEGVYHSGNDGCYDIRKNGFHRVNNDGTPYSSWYIDFDDHTSPDNINEGNLMQIDMSSRPADFYTLQIDKLCENTHLYLSVWGHPVNKGSDAEIILSVEDLDGNLLVNKAVNATIDASKNEWQQFVLYFTVPQGHSSVIFKVFSEGGHQGNDFALDDIEVYLCRPNVHVTSPDGVVCEGGSYSLSATYEKSELGGYIAPVEYTWFKNEGDPNDIESWVKYTTGSELSFNKFSSEDNGYYRCVISSNGVEAELNNCNSMSDPIEMIMYQPNKTERYVTIFAGEEYDGALYFQPGVYDIVDKLQNENGCQDQLITHLVVRELRTEYYVKMERLLKGDGSDWDNAMNGYDFAEVLPHVKDGTTFYIADGMYHPYFNTSGVESDGTDRHYVANSAINIIGGYSPKATGNASTTTPDPFIYHTVLSGDFLEDDVWTVDGCSMVHDENEDVDNLKGESLLWIDMSERGGKSTIKNVEFSGMRSGNGSPSLLTVHGYRGTDAVESNGLELYRCSFSQAYSGVSASGVSDIVVSECEVSKLLFTGVSVNYANKSILIDRSTFSYCGGYALVMNDNAAPIKLRNSTFVNNRTDYSNTRNIGGIDIFNNTFLTCGGNQGVLLGSSMNFNLVGNIFASGGMIVVTDGDTDGKINSICNLYVGISPSFKKDKDIVTTRSALPRFLDVVANGSSTFIPSLKRNDGGFTTTVAVTNPSFENGSEMSTIRFAKSNMLEKINIDETGKIRLYNTCMGAYEYIGNLCDDPYYSVAFVSNPITKESHTVDLVVPYDEVPSLMLMNPEGEVISKEWYNWYSIKSVTENKYQIEFNMTLIRSKKLDPLTPFVLIVKQGDRYVKIAYMYVSRL